MTAFETPRLIVRPFRAEDLDALAVVASDPEVMRFVGDGQPLGRAAVAEWIVRSRQNVARFGYGTAAVVEREAGALIGWTGFARPPEGGEEVVYGLAPAWQGRGLGHELLAGLVGFAGRALAPVKLRALIYPDNAASAALLARAGFTLADRAYEGEDTHLYEKEIA